MMEKIDKALEVGSRLRRVRQAKGLTQDELAQAFGTSPQNISKWEKKGVPGINDILKLSDILGQDLLSDEMDEEGSVGVLGMEILRLLLENNGRLEVEQLGLNMHGLSMARLSNEIFKLERIGMCVREQFRDFSDKECDVLFISAKGLITFKTVNSPLSEETLDMINKCDSYEELLDYLNAPCYQDYVENHPEIKKIQSLENSGSYRANYIAYLRRYCKDNIITNKRPKDPEELLPGVSCYHDILYRMIMNMDDDSQWNSYLNDFFNGWETITALEEELQTMADELFNESSSVVITRAKRAFANEFPSIKDYQIEADQEEHDLDETDLDYLDYIGLEPGDVIPIDADEEYIEKYKQYKSALNKLKKLENADIFNWAPDAVYQQKMASGMPDKDPTKWFSIEEIESFINKNLHPATTPEEKELDLRLKEINDLLPESLLYYAFPPDWEENGLAEKIRDLYGVPFVPEPEDLFSYNNWM